MYIIYSFNKISEYEQDALSLISLPYDMKQIENIYSYQINTHCGHYYDWNSKDVCDWISVIYNGYFSDKIKYKKLYDIIIKYNINGSTLCQISELLLKTIGLSKIDITKLMEKLNTILNKQNTKCHICLNKADMIQIPCQHVTFCHKCYNTDPNKYKKCFYCRTKVTKVYHIKMAGF